MTAQQAAQMLAVLHTISNQILVFNLGVVVMFAILIVVTIVKR